MSSNAFDSTAFLDLRTIVICIPIGVTTSSTDNSGKTLYVWSPILILLPHLSKDFSDIPPKSLTLGNTSFTNLSRKLYALSLLSVDCSITGIPSLSLKLDMAFLWFCHAWFLTSDSYKILFEFIEILIDFLVARDHIPTVTTTFSSFGTALTFFMSNFFANAGRISFLNCANVAIRIINFKC